MTARFAYSRHGLSPSEQRLERWLEILPGATSWSILLGMLALSLLMPIVAAVAVIAFYLYWLFRLLYLTLFLVLSYLRLAWERRTDWMAMTRSLDQLEASARPLIAARRGGSCGQRISRWIHHREVDALRRHGLPPPPSESVYHVVMFPIVREERAIYESGIQSLMQQDFPCKRMIVVLAVEERAPEPIRAAAHDVAAAHRDAFDEILVVIHPDGQPGEAKVKGANVTWAAKQTARYLEQRGIPFERVILSCFDADTVVGRDYVSCLTYAFLVCPHRTRASFQPIPVYHNNIWDVPAFARILDAGASFFQLIEATNPEKLVTFSSHSMSFQALVEMDYWPVDMISDDSAIFWKGLIHFNGDYRVVPLSVTVSMDIAASRTWWKTVVNVYKQKRRWAWGVENFPIVVRGFLQTPGISWWDKLRHTFKMFEGHVSWATWAFLLTGIGWLPAVFAGREFANSVMYYTAPRIAGMIFNLASLALIATILLSLAMLPRPSGRWAPLRKLVHIGEWLLIPLVATGLSALPALDAQTRLVLGRYMEFWVTEKRRLHASPTA